MPLESGFLLPLAEFTVLHPVLPKSKSGKSTHKVPFPGQLHFTLQSLFASKMFYLIFG